MFIVHVHFISFLVELVGFGKCSDSERRPVHAFPGNCLD